LFQVNLRVQAVCTLHLDSILCFINNLLVIYWQETANQKQLFLYYAKKHNYDPLIPKNWYSHAIKLNSAKVCQIDNSSVLICFGTQNIGSVLYYYDGKLSKALIHLFPKIGLKEIYFPHNGNYWIIVGKKPNNLR
jgi:hypothetical protein